LGFPAQTEMGRKDMEGAPIVTTMLLVRIIANLIKVLVNSLMKGLIFFQKSTNLSNIWLIFRRIQIHIPILTSLKKMYREALSHRGIVGLVIGTRPDCISEEVIDYLSYLSNKYFISLEFGVESTLEKTLLKINRCHSFEDSKNAFKMAKNKNIHLGAHLIIGLPGETREDILHHSITISKLPIQTLKLHQLQIVKQSVMSKQYSANAQNFKLFTVEDYIDLIVDFVGLLRPDIVIERFISESPASLLLAPKWNLKNFEIVAKIEKKLIEKNTWQGKFYKEPSFMTN